MRLELCDRVLESHVRDQAQIQLRCCAVRQDRHATRSGVTAHQPFDVHGGPAADIFQRLSPARIASPVLDAERFLGRLLADPLCCHVEHILVRCGNWFHTVQQAVDRRIALRVDQRVERLHQMPRRAVDARTIRRMNVLGRSTSPLLTARDQLRFDHALGAERDRDAPVPVLRCIGHQYPVALLERGAHCGRE